MDKCELFLCGDVMTGRGIDQILPHSCDPALHERYVRNAKAYVALAEDAHGDIPAPVEFEYIWGDALQVLEDRQPDVRIINLETSITTNDDPWPRKGIHYRMHPDNVPCLSAADIDCCVLANNHVLDWGYDGLAETLESLEEAGISSAGAGPDRKQSLAPAIFPTDGAARVLVFGIGCASSGIPDRWAADETHAGVNLMDPTDESVNWIKKSVSKHKRPNDVVMASIHWGGNWGYDIPERQQRFAHQLIDEADVDLIHGHSSHHVKGFEIYRGHLVLYGCGDFITDYEGISGNEQFRGEVSLMYFPQIDIRTGELSRLEMVPTQIKRFQIHRATTDNVRWLKKVLSREGEQFDVEIEVEVTAENILLARLHN